MSELSTESSMTIAIAIAVTLHAVPLLLADPEPDPTISVETDCCFRCGHDDDPLEDTAEEIEPMRLDRPYDLQLAREQAIAAARIGGIGSFRDESMETFGGPPHVVYPLTPASRFLPPPYDDGEVYVETPDCYWCFREAWKIRTYPELSTTMRPAPPSVLSIHPLQLAGGLEKSTVRRYLKRHLSELARCQAPSLGLGRTQLGLVFTQILIGRDGRVRQVIVRDESPVVRHCVERALFAIEFPQPANRELTQVNVPLHYGTTVASAGNLVR